MALSLLYFSLCLPPHLGVSLAEQYTQFASELREVHRVLRKHCSTPAARRTAKRDADDALDASRLPHCLTCTIELEVRILLRAFLL